MKKEKKYNRWLIEVASKIANKERKVEQIMCPQCNEKCIDYLYIGDKKTRIGYLQVWCNNCLNGIYISRAAVPNGLKMISFEDTIGLNGIIPHYHEITPDKQEIYRRKEDKKS